jgi:hypothetical protein
VPLKKNKAELCETRKLKRKYGWIKPRRKKVKKK